MPLSNVHVGERITAPALRNDFDVVGMQALAFAQKENVQLIGVGDATVIEYAGMFDGSPTALAAVVTFGPVRRTTVVGARIDQFEGRAVAIMKASPSATGIIADFIHNDANRIGFKNAEIVCGNSLVGHGQGNAISAIAEAAVVIAVGNNRIEASMIGQKPNAIIGHDDVAVDGDEGVRGKGETDTAVEPPRTDVHRSGSAIVQLE